MKLKPIFLCVACALLLGGCQSSCQYDNSSSYTYRRSGNDEHYVHKTKGYGYDLKSNGKLMIKDGAVQELDEGHEVEIVVSESGKEYRYKITKDANGIKTEGPKNPLTEADKARIKKVLEDVEKHRPESSTPPSKPGSPRRPSSSEV
jgi:hypothetical protein